MGPIPPVAEMSNSPRHSRSLTSSFAIARRGLDGRLSLMITTDAHAHDCHGVNDNDYDDSAAAARIVNIPLD